jgi:hypothetical protein
MAEVQFFEREYAATVVDSPCVAGANRGVLVSWGNDANDLARRACVVAC